MKASTPAPDKPDIRALFTGDQRLLKTSFQPSDLFLFQIKHTTLLLPLAPVCQEAASRPGNTCPDDASAGPRTYASSFVKCPRCTTAWINHLWLSSPAPACLHKVRGEAMLPQHSREETKPGTLRRCFSSALSCTSSRRARHNAGGVQIAKCVCVQGGGEGGYGSLKIQECLLPDPNFHLLGLMP